MYILKGQHRNYNVVYSSALHHPTFGSYLSCRTNTIIIKEPQPTPPTVRHAKYALLAFEPVGNTVER